MGAGSPLSFHFTPNHRYERYLDAFSKVVPLTSLILDPSRDDYLNIKNRVGTGRIILRNYEWSDGGLSVLHRAAADPEGTGRWMAQKWIQLVNEWGGVIDKEHTFFTGVNEYTVIPGMPIAPFVVCESVFARTLASAGLKPCIGNEGVGHPANLNSEGMVDWSPYAEWEKVLQETGGILGVHEYWRGEIGPYMNVKPVDAARNRYWYAWRFFQCPFDVPIAVTEWGIDQKVDAPMGTPSQGWVGVVDAQTYANQLAEYCRKAVTDKRFVGAMIFTHDYAATEWWSYDTDRGLPIIIDAGNNVPKIDWYVPGTSPTPPMPIPPQPPVVDVAVVLPIAAGSFRITGRFHAAVSDRHEGIDLGAATGTSVVSIADGVVAYVGNHETENPPPVNGGYGLYIRVWHPKLMMHTFYAHLSKQDVVAGMEVKAGQHIGLSGNTGNSTGPHLHFETRLAGDSTGKYNEYTPLTNGRSDPESILARYNVSFSGGGSKSFLPVITM